MRALFQPGQFDTASRKDQPVCCVGGGPWTGEDDFVSMGKAQCKAEANPERATVGTIIHHQQ